MSNLQVDDRLFDRYEKTVVTVENEPSAKRWDSVIKVSQIGEVYQDKLAAEGITTVQQLRNLSIESLATILSISDEFAEKLQDNADEYLTAEPN